MRRVQSARSRGERGGRGGRGGERNRDGERSNGADRAAMDASADNAGAPPAQIDGADVQGTRDNREGREGREGRENRGEGRSERQRERRPRQDRQAAPVDATADGAAVGQPNGDADNQTVAATAKDQSQAVNRGDTVMATATTENGEPREKRSRDRNGRDRSRGERNDRGQSDQQQDRTQPQAQPTLDGFATHRANASPGGVCSVRRVECGCCPSSSGSSGSGSRRANGWSAAGTGV